LNAGNNRAIFEYFDSLLLGLTATPRDEVDRDTYGLFDLQQGMPTFAYELDDAVKDGFLVPFKAMSVPLKFQREGLKYDEMDDEDQARWDAIDWDEDGNVPRDIDPESVNRWLFNTDTVDQMLKVLMTRGHRVAGGDRDAPFGLVWSGRCDQLKLNSGGRMTTTVAAHRAKTGR
jgi:type I restriction enzyme R subunit